jgi:hypothetical protein
MKLFNPTTIYINQEVLKISDFSFEHIVSTVEVYNPVTDTTDTIPTFQVSYAYSIDQITYSEFAPVLSVPPHLDSIPLFIAINCVPIPHDSNKSSIYIDHNVDQFEQYIIIKDFIYSSNSIPDHKIRYITHQEIINQYPKWNLYDNHNPSIKRWIAQCNAIAESYGHQCIYFRTQPTETNETLRQNYQREVVSVKKIPIVIKDNEIGNVDKIIYSEWDMPLTDDFIVHIVWDKFKIAFGEYAIPSEKDYLYLPLLNKMYRVSIVQPANVYMGKIAWWEVNLAKYEEDDTVKIDKYNFPPDYSDALTLLNTGDLLTIDGTGLLDQFDGFPTEQIEQHVSESLNSKEDIGEKTIQEKRDATEGYTNVLTDSTAYVSLKESEQYRHYYDKRLKIIDVKYDTNLFPITMYDNSQVNHNVIAMNYNLSDFTRISKESTLAKSFTLEFDIILISKFGGSLFDIIDPENNYVYTSIFIDRQQYPQLSIRDRLSVDPEDSIHLIPQPLKEKEVYNVSIKCDLNQYSFYYVNIYKLENTKKNQIFHSIYSVPYLLAKDEIPIGHLNLFGGKFLSSNITLLINDKNIFTDYCNPLLKMVIR